VTSPSDQPGSGSQRANRQCTGRAGTGVPCSRLDPGSELQLCQDEAGHGFWSPAVEPPRWDLESCPKGTQLTCLGWRDPGTPEAQPVVPVLPP
jgi:hypothetical protein